MYILIFISSLFLGIYWAKRDRSSTEPKETEMSPEAQKARLQLEIFKNNLERSLGDTDAAILLSFIMATIREDRTDILINVATGANEAYFSGEINGLIYIFAIIEKLGNMYEANELDSVQAVAFDKHSPYIVKIIEKIAHNIKTKKSA